MLTSNTRIITFKYQRYIFPGLSCLAFMIAQSWVVIMVKNTFSFTYVRVTYVLHVHGTICISLLDLTCLITHLPFFSSKLDREPLIHKDLIFYILFPFANIVFRTKKLLKNICQNEQINELQIHLGLDGWISLKSGFH